MAKTAMRSRALFAGVSGGVGTGTLVVVHMKISGLVILRSYCPDQLAVELKHTGIKTFISTPNLQYPRVI